MGHGVMSALLDIVDFPTVNPARVTVRVVLIWTLVKMNVSARYYYYHYLTLTIELIFLFDFWSILLMDLNVHCILYPLFAV